MANKWAGPGRNWACRHCSSNYLVEVLSDVTTTVRVDGVDADGQLILGPQADAAGGSVSGYRCGSCERPVIHDGRPVADRKTMAGILAGR